MVFAKIRSVVCIRRRCTIAVLLPSPPPQICPKPSAGATASPYSVNHRTRFVQQNSVRNKVLTAKNAADLIDALNKAAEKQDAPEKIGDNSILVSNADLKKFTARADALGLSKSPALTKLISEAKSGSVTSDQLAAAAKALNKEIKH